MSTAQVTRSNHRGQESVNAQNKLIGIALGKQSQYPIFQCLCSCLDVIDIIHLSRTCVDLSTLYQRLLKTRWNVDRCLKRFVEDPVRFRHDLDKFGAIISGSFALQFFDFQQWADSDLDVFMEDNESVSELVDLLGRQEGYHKPPGQDSAWEYDGGPESWWGLVSVTNLYRHDGRKIQIMRCVNKFQSVIEGFYSTAVINIITPTAAYSLFPHLTFKQRYFTYLASPKPKFKALLDKYTRRGWGFRPLLLRDYSNDHPSDNFDGHAQRGFRSMLEETGFESPLHTGFGTEKLFSDRSTWKIEFDADDRIPDKQSSADFKYWHMNIGYVKRHGDMQGISDPHEMDPPLFHSVRETESFYHPVLRHPTQTSNNDWRIWLVRKLQPFAKEQLAQLAEHNRPTFYEQFMTEPPLSNLSTMRRHGHWTPPPHVEWHYYDDCILEWFEDYKMAQKLAFREQCHSERFLSEKLAKFKTTLQGDIRTLPHELLARKYEVYGYTDT